MKNVKNHELNFQVNRMVKKTVLYPTKLKN